MVTHWQPSGGSLAFHHKNDCMAYCKRSALSSFFSSRFLTAATPSSFLTFFWAGETAVTDDDLRFLSFLIFFFLGLIGVSSSKSSSSSAARLDTAGSGLGSFLAFFFFFGGGEGSSKANSSSSDSDMVNAAQDLWRRSTRPLSRLRKAPGCRNGSRNHTTRRYQRRRLSRHSIDHEGASVSSRCDCGSFCGRAWINKPQNWSMHTNVVRSLVHQPPLGCRGGFSCHHGFRPDFDHGRHFTGSRRGGQVYHFDVCLEIVCHQAPRARYG